MAGGRPTTYTDEVLEAARDYAENSPPAGEVVHTVVGMCRAIKRSKSTVYSWKSDKDKPEFLDILEEIEESQHVALVGGGLSGGFNSAITKMMLTKHGYSDKTEVDHTTGGDKIAPAFGFVDVGEVNEAD